MCLIFSAAPPLVEAATGDKLRTVAVPAAAQCDSGIGTSVTIVPGSLVGLTQYPILLVESCFAGATPNNLYFIDPSTNPGTLVKTIPTSPTPPKGWGSLSLRGDKGDLLGCGNAADGTHGVYGIDVSPFNGTANDGAATFLFNAQPGFDICDGVAWDTGDDTVWQSPDVSSTIYHFSATGTQLGTLPAPGGCPNSGLAVGGTSIFAACNGNTTIYELNKSGGSVITSFPSGGRRTEDLECDPVTFSGQNKDVIWSKDAFDNEFFAFEIPAGRCGFAGGGGSQVPECSDTDGNGVIDNDGDSLCDNWEDTGVDWNRDGTVDLVLYDVNKNGTIEASERADKNHKDLYMEIDFMQFHQPNADALTDVTTAFANSPVANPDGAPGVRLHVQVDEQVTHSDNVAFQPCTAAPAAGGADFDTIKNASFGTTGERAAGVNVTNAKRFIARYSLYAHNLQGLGGTSGCSELPGNDFVVSLGSWTAVGGHNVGTRNEQAGTFMHEFGHDLNLRHGGADDVNCKPNYLSVMTYTRQIDNNPIPGRPLDYSRAALATLDEAALNEGAGIGGPAGSRTAFGPPPVRVAAGDAPIDWNRDGDAADNGVSANINNTGGGCNGSGAVLSGYDDWSNLKYNFRATTDFADGVHLSSLQVDEITATEAAELAGADLSVTKACTPGTVVPTATASCTIDVTNNGAATASQLTVTDDLDPAVTLTGPPAGDGFVCTTQAGNPEIRCTRAELAAGQTAKITYSIRVGENVGPDTALTNTATATADTADSNPGNNTATATVRTPACTIDRRGATSAQSITGTPGADVICGSRFADAIRPLAGDDVVFGGGGSDAIDDTAGNDKLLGGDGDDGIKAGPGNDLLVGNADNDALDGGDGDDTLLGGTGNDGLVGGAGADALDGGPGADACLPGPGANPPTTNCP